MPRSAATADVFSAIAEPRRREIIELLARSGPHAVTTLVDLTGLAQPSVSKHLGVLLKVGVVAVARDGRQRVYRLEPRKLKPVHDWAAIFEKFWSFQLDRIKQRAEASAAAARSTTARPHRA